MELVARLGERDFAPGERHFYDAIQAEEVRDWPAMRLHLDHAAHVSCPDVKVKIWAVRAGGRAYDD